jgi:hypothetical protein
MGVTHRFVVASPGANGSAAGQSWINANRKSTLQPEEQTMTSKLYERGLAMRKRLGVAAFVGAESRLLTTR